MCHLGVEQVGSPVPTVQLLSLGTHLGDVKSCKILGDGILGKILGDVKIPHVGSRRSPAQFTSLQGCNSLSYLSPSIRNCKGQGCFLVPKLHGSSSQLLQLLLLTQCLCLITLIPMDPRQGPQ